MRKVIAVMLLLALTGCASRTDYGECIGLNGEENPRLRYEYSARNIVLGVVFIEMILPPIFVVLDQLKCPVGRNPPAIPAAGKGE